MNKLRAWLEAQGFRIGDDPLRSPHNEVNWYAWRRSKLDAVECECNGPKTQLVVRPHSMFVGGRQHGSVEVEIVGEQGGIWWNLKAYSMPEAEVMARLDQVEVALVMAWNALCPATPLTE
jgi:hypothetical protein